MAFNTLLTFPTQAGAAAELRAKQTAVARDGPIFHLNNRVSRRASSPYCNTTSVLGGFFPVCGLAHREGPATPLLIDQLIGDVMPQF
jgi:hypothetical protein